MKRIIKIALDVDSKSFTACGWDPKSGTSFKFRVTSEKSRLLKKLKEIQEAHLDCDLEVAYEATYLGFSLFRYLSKEGIKTYVVAPSLIPEIPGHRVKTDRTDAEKLLQFWLQDLLTFVTPPSPEEEEARSLIRCREFLVRMRRASHSRILSLVHVYGLEYAQSEQKKTYRGKHFWAWLRKEITQMPEGWRFIFSSLIDGYDMIDQLIKTFDAKIADL
ncbi:MAG: transposase, partial [Bdellovibrionaceae bacterium]|nr:transposase [Pseudobdellovibrionaceae bacterium]